jgi:hypothetical protein
MTNRSSSKKHCYVDVKNRRPKSTLGTKGNKEKARIRRAEVMKKLGNSLMG